jgi:hypothetical protein
MKSTAIFFAALLGLSPAYAGEGAIRASYDVAVKGVNIMKLRYSADLTDTGYAASLNVKTTGMAKWLSEYKIELESEGAKSKGKFSPANFARERKKNNKKSENRFIWKAGAPQIDDNDVAGPERVQDVLSQGTTDPLAMLLNIGFSEAENPCKGKLRVFDGRDVMDATFSGAAGEEQGTIKCKLSVKTIAGKSYESAEDKNTLIDVYGIVLKPMAAPFVGRNIHMPITITGTASGQSFEASLENIEITGTTTN